MTYFIQTNVTRWQGIIWAASIVEPVWFCVYLVVAHDPCGINVALAYLDSVLQRASELRRHAIDIRHRR